MSEQTTRREFLRVFALTGLGTTLLSSGVISTLSLLSNKAFAETQQAPMPAPVGQDEALQAASPAEVQSIIDSFTQNESIQDEGLSLVMDPLASNPSSIPVQALFNEEITEDNYCEELIFIAEGNPLPLVCRFKFTPLGRTNEIAFRARLIDAQYIRALARMNDGRILGARRFVTVIAGACGM